MFPIININFCLKKLCTKHLQYIVKIQNKNYKTQKNCHGHTRSPDFFFVDSSRVCLKKVNSHTQTHKKRFFCK